MRLIDLHILHVAKILCLQATSLYMDSIYATPWRQYQILCFLHSPTDNKAPQGGLDILEFLDIRRPLISQLLCSQCFPYRLCIVGR